MIMSRREALLLPVSPWFIGMSLFISLVINMLLGLSQALWLPDFLAVCIFFWGIHQPIALVSNQRADASNLAILYLVRVN